MGRDARLELVFERSGPRTVLTDAYAEPPYRVGRVHDLDGAAYVIVVCSGPGIFAGDRLRQTVRVARGADVVLVSQAALQVHPSDAEKPAEIVHEYDLAEDAGLFAHWDPVIPFAASRIEQRFDLRLAASSRLYWSDALMAGRASRNEAWMFNLLAHELRVQVDDALVYLERYKLSPASTPIQQPWRMGNARYLATTLAWHLDLPPEALLPLQRALDGIAGVRAGVDAVEPGLLVSKLAAPDGPPFAAARRLLRESILRTTFARPNLLGRK